MPTYDSALPIFAYGTLRDPTHPMHRIRSGDRAVLGPDVQVAGLRLMGRDAAFPAAARSEHYSVIVGTVVRPPWQHYQGFIAGYDSLEGFRPHDLGSSLYLRETIHVPGVGPCWIYLGSTSLLNSPPYQHGVPGGDWLSWERARWASWREEAR